MGLGHLGLLIGAYQQWAPLLPQRLGDRGPVFLDYILKRWLLGP